MILLADRRASRDEDDVGVGVLQRVFNAVGAVGQIGDVERDAAVAADEGGEHDGVAVDDAVAFGHRSRRQQFVAGDQDGDPRQADEADAAGADRREQSGVLRAEAPAGRQHARAGGDVLALPADVAAGRDGFDDGQRAVALGGLLDGQHGVGAGRDGAPVMMRTACPAVTCPGNGRPGSDSPITDSERGLQSAGAERLLGLREGVAVHRRRGRSRGR